MLSKIGSAVTYVGNALINASSAQWVSFLRSWGGILGGVAITVGLMSAADQTTLAQAFDKMLVGLQQIGTGLSTVWAALLLAWPILLSIWAAASASWKSRTKELVRDPKALAEIASKPEVVAAVADSPAVKEKIVTTPEMAAAAPSQNVISK